MRKLFIYGLIVFSSLAVGATAGVLVKRFVSSEILDYGNIDFEALKPDCAKIVSEIEAYRGAEDVADIFSASDIVNY